ncbi:MAG TPA: asparagine synthase-related protein [Solirubrobacteraceae bacterium]|nr:asparagine synthase-related protein [Solirubrobacteraceae bacterium]
MSAICGLVRLDGRPVDAPELAAMAEPLRHWGPDGGGTWREGAAGLGQLVLHTTPESVREAGPVTVAGGSAVVTAAARLDNREELCRELRIEAGAPDGAVVAAAYERWGEGVVRRILGDWAFAAWHPADRRLVLARDHYGTTALYHHFDGTTFAFASGQRALLALPHVPGRLDELGLAQYLAAWPADGTATLYAGLARLPPAHLLVLDGGRAATHEYWRPEEAPDVRLPSDDAYVERFLELFAAAVRTRLRSTGPVGSTLSSGLDSSAVTTLAARESGGAITALTAVPAHPEVAARVPDRVTDEWPAAARVAALAGVAHVAVDGSTVTPLEAIERWQQRHEEPIAAVPNLPWLLDLLETSARRGLRVLLTGQAGNGGVSWPGEEGVAFRRLLAGDARGAMRALAARRRAGVGWPLALRRELVGPARRRAAGELARWRRRRPDRIVGPLIEPSFARRLDLAGRMRASGWDPAGARLAGEAWRLATLLPGVMPAGAQWHEMGAAHGLDVRDPTADVRLLEFCFGVPPDQFVRGDRDRWLLRRALTGLVPPDVQWGRRRGVQGGDIAFRLRADEAAVTAAIDRLARSATVRDHLSVGTVRTAWDEVRRDRDAPALQAAATVCAGLTAGHVLLRCGAVK